MGQIRVLVVDDSAFMRRIIKEMLNADPQIEVIDTARNGIEGVEKALSLDPDVITMDIEMPGMNGLEAIEEIMKHRRIPIIVFSSLSSEGAEVTLEALDKGAADYVCKNISRSVLDVMQMKKDLVGKVKAVVRTFEKDKRDDGTASQQDSQLANVIEHHGKIELITIGASTGGPKALQEILPAIPAEIESAIVVTIHMPPDFTRAFADRLNRVCKLPVREAEDGEKLKQGCVLVSPGGIHTKIRRNGFAGGYVKIDSNPYDAIYKPCIDITMKTAAECYRDHVMGVILTGMGHDGTEGIRAIKKNGGISVVQDELSCTVYGMPRSVVEAGLADRVVPLKKIPQEIMKLV